MPGLVGIFSERPININLFKTMIKHLNHDNFYKIDKYCNENVGLGRVHLNIFNPQPQPIYNQDKSHMIFMDGKIFGYDEDLEKLKKKGYKFKFNNDPEFCLCSYLEYGLDFIKKLNGEFVIIIHDLKNRETIVINDRYGLRPVNYHYSDNKLIISPEIFSFFADKNLKKELNEQTIADFLVYGRIIGDKTFFRDTYVLPPATVLRFVNGKISLDQYWKWHYETNYTKSEDEFLEELEHAVKTALKIRLEDDMQFGIALSGGLDSRALVAGLPPNAKKKVIAYTWGPPYCNEVKIAKQVAEKANIECKSILVNQEMLINNSNLGVNRSDGAVYLGYNLYQNISNNTKNFQTDVLFTGVGLDTIITTPWLSKRKIKNKDNEKLSNILFDSWRPFSDNDLKHLLKKAHYEKIKKFSKLSFRNAFKECGESEPSNIRDYLIQIHHTRRSMYPALALLKSAIEVITPAFDNSIVDISLTMPPEYRNNHFIYQKLLKRLSPVLMNIPYNRSMIRPNMPHFFWNIGKSIQHIKRFIKRKLYQWSNGKITLKDKQTYDNWDELFRIDKKLVKFLKKLLLNDKALSKKYLNQKYINKLFQIHQDGKRNLAHGILYLATFELLLQELNNLSTDKNG